MWQQVKKIIQQHKRFVITSHVGPDGDALGSELGLAYFLKSLGKEATILNATPPAKNFSFMAEDRAVQTYNEKRDQKKIDQADAVFIVDISEWKRLGIVGERVQQSKAKTICIDHHIAVKKLFDYQIIDNKAGSTGELIYRLIKEMKKKLNPKIAEPLYIAALTDTGSFHYANTSPATHLMVAELLTYGVNPLKCFNQIYERRSLQHFRLLGQVLLNAKLECHGKLAWAAIDKKMVQKAKAQMEETEGFVEMLRTIETVDVSLLFREESQNKTRVSLRSKENANVYQVAHKLGGGGHKRAAGVTLNMPLKKAIPKVLTEVKKCFH